MPEKKGTFKVMIFIKPTIVNSKRKKRRNLGFFHDHDTENSVEKLFKFYLAYLIVWQHNSKRLHDFSYYLLTSFQQLLKQRF